jgi:hypothetical protein
MNAGSLAEPYKPSEMSAGCDPKSGAVSKVTLVLSPYHFSLAVLRYFGYTTPKSHKKRALIQAEKPCLLHELLRHF